MRNERGEGKIGCVVTLAVLVLCIAVGSKVLPVYYADNTLTEAAEDICAKAGILSGATVEAQLRTKAKDLEIPEALAKGALTVSTTGDKQSGSCTVKLKFTRKVDIFGAYTLPVEVDKVIMKPYLDAR